MTPRLAETLEAIRFALTCQSCQGNGGLGSRVYAPDTGTGPQGTRSVAIWSPCGECRGAGIKPLADFIISPGEPEQ